MAGVFSYASQGASGRMQEQALARSTDSKSKSKEKNKILFVMRRLNLEVQQIVVAFAPLGARCL